MVTEKKDLREEPSLKNETGAASGKNETLKRVGIVGAIALVAFLLGFLPMWLSARNYANERDAAMKTLRPNVLQNTLATATINARRGEFEQARQQTSDYFTDLRAEYDREESAFSPPQREAVQKILAQRDETITQLARGDAAAVDRLTDLYFNFMQAKNSPAPEKK
ncbi:MAG: hypothetical protein AVDCRST_MAG74-1250 [uncultured Pyrinomonadaceae bacterium]|uniref:Uncharacterized protein n=1 Tax=uncultured Pyrinomonadaceae bacterium TaxID=2283094 RepID=A0A6J4NU45_9BACT|nr:MAG: hypothetical protein AVDCRST_MAG74-1250 [uncultured Pyrinomonadaceae bacterium]